MGSSLSWERVWSDLLSQRETGLGCHLGGGCQMPERMLAHHQGLLVVGDPGDGKPQRRQIGDTAWPPAGPALPSRLWPDDSPPHPHPSPPPSLVVTVGVRAWAAAPVTLGWAGEGHLPRVLWESGAEVTGVRCCVTRDPFCPLERPSRSPSIFLLSDFLPTHPSSCQSSYRSFAHF